MSELNEFQRLNNLVEIPQIFLDETHQQLLNDLRRTGYAVNEFNRGPKDFKILLEKVEVLLTQLREENLSQFYQFLYLIDLPEVVVKSFNEDKLSISDLSRIVLIREWKKVDFRNRYAKKDEDGSAEN